MTSAGILKDALAITSLLSSDVPQDNSLRYRDRQLQYLTPRTTSYVSSVNFDTSTIINAWSDLSEAFLSIPLTITSTAILPASPWPNLAFKSSALSIFNRIVVRTASGQVLCDEVNTGAFADHLRLAFEKDQSWLKLVAPAIHYHRDQSNDGVVGLRLNADIANPSTCKFTSTPAVGIATDNGNHYNPTYNVGHHERNLALMRACTSSTGASNIVGGVTYPCSLNIPLSVMHDFFKQLSFPITGVNLSFEFYLSPTASPPVSTDLHPLVVGSSAIVQAPDAVTILTVAVVPTSEHPTPRLYYHAITLQPEATAIMSQRLAEGFSKTINWRRYEIQKELAELQGVVSGATRTFQVSSSANAPRRVWVMAYPANQINKTSHPSVLVTGANGFDSLQMMVNGKQLYNNPLMTLSEQYDELKQAMHLGQAGDAESLLPFDSFRLTSRIHCLDLTRLAGRLSDPNAPISLQLQYRVLSQGAVDIVILLESEYTATFNFSTGKVGVTVGPATYQ